MLKDSLIEIFERDLKKLSEEISLYKDESALWIVKGEISNSAGNLCLHLIGNLNHFIGAIIGKSGFVRDRDSEFSSKNIPRKDILANIDSTIKVVTSALSKLSDKDLPNEFPYERNGKNVTTEYMMLHLLAHFSYHLGQINYHRRLVS